MVFKKALQQSECAACERSFVPKEERVFLVCHSHCLECFTKLVKRCLDKRGQPGCCQDAYDLEEVQRWAFVKMNGKPDGGMRQNKDEVGLPP